MLHAHAMQLLVEGASVVTSFLGMTVPTLAACIPLRGLSIREGSGL